MVDEFEVENFVPRRRPQYLAAFVASIGAFALGNVISWTSPALPDMEASNYFGELSKDDKSWIASIVTLAALISGPIAGYCTDKFGRRMTMLILCFPCFAGWILIAFAQNIWMIKSGRFITGFCIGAWSLVIPIFQCEMAEEKIRGALSTSFPAFGAAGILCTYILGTFFSWFALTLTYAVVPIVFFLCMYNVPESPVYLMSKSRNKKAGLALMWFRGATNVEQIEPELHQLRRGLEEKRDQKISAKEFFSPPVLKPMSIALLLMLFQQLSGINAVIFFSTHIFQSAGTTIDPNLSSIIVGFVLLLSVILSTFVIDRAGRRFLLITSDAGMTIALVALGVFFYLKDQNQGESPEGLSWLPLVSLMLFMITFNFGYGPVPWIMMGELLPAHVKGFGSALTISFNWFWAFMVTKSFEDFTLLLGDYGCYWLFALICFVGTAFSYCFVPETKGKTLDEIQRSFKSTN